MHAYMDGWVDAWMDACMDEFGCLGGPGRGPSIFNPLFFSPEALRHSRIFSEARGESVIKVQVPLPPSSVSIRL